MKEVKGYECGICHRLYRSEAIAMVCETSHPQPVGCIKADFTHKDAPSGAYPDMIDILFSDMTKATYCFGSFIGRYEDEDKKEEKK